MKSILLVVPDQAQQAATLRRWGTAHWSAAFVAFLEKRGWLSVDVRVLADLRGASDISSYDLVILAWHGNGGPTEEQAQWFKVARRPTLIEGPLCEALKRQFGLLGDVDPILLQPGQALNLIDADIREDLSRRCPHTVGAEARQVVLDEKTVRLAEKEFDFIGARFKAAKASLPADAASQMLIGLLPGIKRRFERQGFLLEDIILDLTMAYCLRLVKAKLGLGRHADRMRQFIGEAVDATLRRCEGMHLSEEEQAKLDRVRARLNGAPGSVLPEEVRAGRNSMKLLTEIERQPQADLDALVPNAFPRITIANLLLANAFMPEGETRDRLFLHLRDRFYDPVAGAFRAAAALEGRFQLREGTIAHPSIVQALALLSGPIEMPHFGEVSSAGFTADQIAAWNRAPLLHCRMTGEDWRELAVLAESGAPALLQQGMTIVSSLPLLAWIVHYHTIGPLPESYDSAPSRGFMAAEELIVLCIERLVRRAARPVPRVAPWPWGYNYALSIRHDVDRIPDPVVFERLMEFHRNNRLGVTWYWLPWRLDRTKMLAQLKAGHEIALHAVRSLEKTDESEAIARESGANVVGEAFHGSASDYWAGASSVAQSIRAGFSYSEFAMNMFLFPYAAYPWLEADGSVTLRRGCIGITRSTSTDHETRNDLDFDLEETVALNGEWAGLGMAIVLLNHPDLNFDRLQALVSALPATGRLDWTARQIADWWRRTHQVNHLGWEWDGAILTVTAKEKVSDLSLILPMQGLPPEIEGNTLDAVEIDRSHEGELRIRLALEADKPIRLRFRDGRDDGRPDSTSR